MGTTPQDMMIEFFNKMCSTVSLRHFRTANLEVLSLCNKWQTQKCLWKALSETEVEATFVQADERLKYIIIIVLLVGHHLYIVTIFTPAIVTPYGVSKMVLAL